MKSRTWTKAVSLVLALVLIVGSVPAVSAAEQNAPDLSLPAAEKMTVEPVTETTPSDADPPPEETKPVETTVPAETEPPETTLPGNTGEETEPTQAPEPTEETEPAAVPAEATKPTDPQPSEDYVAPNADDLYKVNNRNPEGLDVPEGMTEEEFLNQLAAYGIGTLAAPTGNSMGPEFEAWTKRYTGTGVEGDYGKYTTVYYNGTEKSIKQYSFKYIRDSSGTYHEVYCINPPKDFADDGYTPSEGTFDSNWFRKFGISQSQARAITLALLYGCPNGTSSSRGSAQFYAERAATQTIIWEILCTNESGTYLRSSTFPYKCNDDRIYRAFATSYFYYGYPGESAESYHTASGDLFKNAYKAISDKMAAHGELPSFAAGRANQAPTYTMTYNRSTGKFSVTLTDTNNMISKATFPSISGVTFSVSGNQLTITADSADKVPTSATSATLPIPNFVTLPILTWEKGSAQEFASCNVTRNDPTPFYFKLKAENPTGDIEITKHTSSGTSLSGWKFEVFTDSACTNRVATATSGTDGKAKVTGLVAGTYYVREVDESSTYPWWGYDPSVKTVTVTEGGTATVSFNNTLLGRIAVQKITSSGGSLGGWTFEIFSDAACTQLVETITTDTTGKATSGYLAPGTYYVREVDESGTYPWWSYDQSVKVVTVSTGGGTATVSFTNVQNGRISIQKTTNTGKDLGGWQFGIYSDSACTQLVETMTTDESGKATSGYLAPGTYYVKELDDGQHPDWTLESDSKAVTVVAGEMASVGFTNIQNGRIKIIKEFPDTGVEPPLSGWTFRVTDSEGKEIEGSPFTTDHSGAITTGYLAPGTYSVEEILPADSLFEVLSENPQTITVVAGETGSVTFTNAIRTARIEIRKVDPAGNPLAGARFLLEWFDGSQWVPVYTTEEERPMLGETSTVLDADGYLTTGEDGIIAFEGLFPGYPGDPIPYRLTEVEAPSGYLLLTDTAWEGTLLEQEGLSVTLTVHNSPGYSLPEAGGEGLTALPILGALLIAAGILAWRPKKEGEKGR